MNPSNELQQLSSLRRKVTGMTEVRLREEFVEVRNPSKGRPARLDKALKQRRHLILLY